MSELLKIFVKSLLVDNVVLVQYLAICPFIGMSSDTGKATGMGIATTFVIILATAVTYALNALFLASITAVNVSFSCFA